jgi:hypothetical protein
MNDQPRRRWFRFSLRTMFVIVTLFACWIGWQTSIVRERKAVLKEMKGNPSFHVTTVSERLDWAVPPFAPLPKVPLVRGWLGDEAVFSLSILGHGEGSETVLARFKKAFPEADVSERQFEPCHPGCFPRGTPIATPQGTRPVESIAVGEEVTAILPSGSTVSVHVQSIFTTDNRLWKIETEAGSVLTTETQPLCKSADDIVPAGELQPGDSILHFQDGEVHSVKVVGVSRTDRVEKVFNLVLGNSEVFVAGGFLARSKPPTETTGESPEVSNHENE